jgi:hypothetical protein
VLITGQEKRSWLEWCNRGGRGIARAGLALLAIAAAALCLTGVTAASAAPPAGSALAWGENFIGQLGDGTTVNRDAPVPVHLTAGTDVTAVAAADRHSLALTSDGRVLAWGFNGAGQLGTRVTAIAAGTDDFSLAPAVPPPGNLPA